VAIIVRSVDTSYGGENGFNQAISLASDALANVKFTEERVLIQKLFDEITLDSGKYCFGVADTFTALEMSAVETLIVYEDLDVQRIELKHPVTGKLSVLHLNKEGAGGGDKDVAFKDPESGVELEVVDKTPLTEWFAVRYKDFGAKLEFVTNKSQEGSQFVKGFGGIGGVLRWKVDFMTLADHTEAGEKAAAITAAKAAAAEARAEARAAAAAAGGGAGGGGAAGGGFGEGDEDEDGAGGGEEEEEEAEEPTPTGFDEELDFM